MKLEELNQANEEDQTSAGSQEFEIPKNKQKEIEQNEFDEFLSSLKVSASEIQTGNENQGNTEATNEKLGLSKTELLKQTCKVTKAG